MLILRCCLITVGADDQEVILHKSLESVLRRRLKPTSSKLSDNRYFSSYILESQDALIRLIEHCGQILILRGMTDECRLAFAKAIEARDFGHQ